MLCGALLQALCPPAGAKVLDQWLHAAGFARIESRDAFSCQRRAGPATG